MSGTPERRVVNLAQKLASFDETWTPKLIGSPNGQLVKLAKLDGDLMWHSHDDEDELFLVLEGELTIEYRDGNHAHLKAGDMHIVPRGVEHNPVTQTGASVLLFEPESTKHTGAHVTDRTVADQEWI